MGNGLVVVARVLALALVALSAGDVLTDSALAVAPPTTFVSFAASSIPLMGSTQLRVAIGNPNQGTGLTSVGFADNLPTGLEVANPTGLSTTCDGVVGVAAGSSSFSLSGGSLGPSQVCTFTVSVTGTTAGDKTNGVAVNSSAGTGNTASASLGVGAPVGEAKLVDDIDATGASNPHDLTNLNGTLVFGAIDGVHGDELWRSDGTRGGTTLVKDIDPNGASNLVVLAKVQSAVFFQANDGTHGAELWRTDGTRAGTQPVGDINPGPGGSNPANLIDVGGTLFFAASDGSHGRELWRSDGTGAGTRLVADIDPGLGDSNPAGLINVGGTLFFAASDGSHGTELWRSDGTAAGTRLVADISTGSGSSNPSDLTNLGGSLLFAARNGRYGAEVWRSDGTPTGTTLLKDIHPGTGDSAPHGLIVAGGRLHFAADDGGHGVELWGSDGTRAGTKLVGDINPGGDANPSWLTNVGGILFFTADDGNRGSELWRSDGTGTGTHLVRDIDPGPAGASPSSLTSAGGTLWFQASDSAYGDELWRSDGTEAGTRLVADIDTAGDSRPRSLANVDGTLFFAADDGSLGSELWRATPCGTAQAGSPCGTPTTVDTALSQSTIHDGGSVTDQATIFGAAPTAAGTIAYTVYTDDHCKNVYTRATPGTNVVANGAAPLSRAITFPRTGHFWWTAQYSGDSHTDTVGARSACAAEPLTVQVWLNGDLTTYNQDEWVATPAVTTLNQDFAVVYSNGSVGVGGHFTMRFTSSNAVTDYLPATGTPAALTGNLVNPTSSPSGVFGADVLALEFDVDFSDAGDLPAASGLRFGDLTLCRLTTLPTGDDVSAANGMTVRQVLSDANTALGGDSSGTPLPLSSLDQLLRRLTGAFSQGMPSDFAQSNLVNGACT